MPNFRELLEELDYLLERKASPEGTRTFRADGEYQKTRGKWVRVKAASGSDWKGKFALGPKGVDARDTKYSWSSAFDDREHKKAIDKHRSAEKAHRGEVEKLDHRLSRLQVRAKTAAPDKREKLVAKHSALATQRELHRAAAQEARANSQAISKELESAKSDLTWKRKASTALKKAAEREGIGIIGRSRIGGSEDEPAGASSEVPTYAPTPDHSFSIGMQAIPGEPESESIPTPKTLWKPNTAPISYVEPKSRDQFSSDYHDQVRAIAKVAPPPEPDHPILKALRTVEIGRAYYGDFKNQKIQKLRAALPKAASAISLPSF